MNRRTQRGRIVPVPGRMRWYVVAWLATWAPVGFFGCLLGLMVGPRESIIALGGLAAAVAALTAVPLDPRRRTRDPSRDARGTQAWAAARRAAAAGTAVTLIGALIALLGQMALPLLVLAVISSPPALQFVRRHVAQPHRAPQCAGGVSVSRFGTERLCSEWRASYPRVLHAASVAALAQEVRRRQEYLDEMERRNPIGFRAWLETGPRADDDPECFVNAMEPRHYRPSTGE